MGAQLKEYFSVEELAAAGLGHAARIRLRAKTEKWGSKDFSKGRGRPERRYLISDLPSPWRIKLARRQSSESPLAAVPSTSSSALIPSACVEAPTAAISYHQLPEHAQRRCDKRVDILAAFADFRRSSNLGLVNAAHQFALEGKKVSARTLLRWIRAKGKKGTAALGGNYGANRKGYIDSRPDIREWLIAKDLELNGAAKEARVSTEEILRGARGEFGDAAPSYKQTQRWLKEFRSKYAVERSFHSEPDRARGRFGVAFGDAAAGTYDFLQLVELDGSPSDCLTIAGRRRQLIIATDVFTRMRWSIVAPSESGEHTGRLFAKIFMAAGLPQKIRTDNGSGFVSARIRALLADFGVEYESVMVGRGDLKPFAESSVHFIQQRLATLPGFGGHNVAMREELRGRIPLLKRRGKSDEEVLGATLTDWELEAFLDEYLTKVYSNSPQAGLSGKTPNQVLAGWVQAGGRVRRLGDARSIQGLLMLSGLTRTVTKKGIDLDGACYQAADFVPWMNKKVLVGRHHEPGKIVVWSLGDRREFICVASNRALMTAAEQRAVAMDAKLVQREHLKVIKKDMRQIISENATPLHESIMRAYQNAPIVDVPSDEFENEATRAGLDSMRALESFGAPKEPHYDEAELVEGAEKLRAIDAKRITQRSEFEEDQRDWERYQALVNVAHLSDDDRDFITRYETTVEYRSRVIVFGSARKAAG